MYDHYLGFDKMPVVWNKFFFKWEARPKEKSVGMKGKMGLYIYKNNGGFISKRGSDSSVPAHFFK